MQFLWFNSYIKIDNKVLRCSLGIRGFKSFKLVTLQILQNDPKLKSLVLGDNLKVYPGTFSNEETTLKLPIQFDETAKVTPEL